MSTKVRNTGYELKRKNPITLGDDSNIEANLKPIKIDSKNSILELSENELKVRGTIDASAITVDGASVQTGDEVGAITALNNATENELVTVGSTTTELDSESYLTFDGSNLKIMSSADTGDYFNINVGVLGYTKITTVDDGGTSAHIELEPDGNVVLDPGSGCVEIDAADVEIDATKKLYFDGGSNTYISEYSGDILRFTVGALTLLDMVELASESYIKPIYAIGWSQIEPTFDATDTEVDFRAGNKQKLTLTNNVTDIHFQFPHVSGNFICVLLQDGTGSRTISNWKTKDADGNAGAGNSGLVLWAGGTAPSNTETADKADIASFYWDADNEIAYGTYAYNF